jgi:hypothetical protein
MIVDHGQAAILGAMNVELDHVDAELDGRSKGGQRVLRAFIRVSAVTAEQDAATLELCRQAFRVRDPHRQILREPSRDFYIHGHAQEIS